MQKYCVIAAFFIALATSGRAQIIVSGSVNGSGSGTFTIQSPLVFSITTTGTAARLVFDEWVTSDGAQNAGLFSGGQITFSLSGTPTSVSISLIDDNAASSAAGSITANDGFIFFGGYSVTTGNTVTIQAGSWTFTGNGAFNPQTVQTFTGNVFLTDSSGVALSNSISAGSSPVPEPSTYALAAGVGVLGWALWRRKRPTAVA